MPPSKPVPEKWMPLQVGISDHYTEEPSVFQVGAAFLMDMERESTKTSRKPRADSIRNRQRLLEAAKTVFSTGGAGASLEAVAREAGVGIGTLYRHFPTREALFEAVYRHEVEQMAELADRLTEDSAPIDALRQWSHANIGLIATKKGMLAALSLAVDSCSPIYAYSFQKLTEAMAKLLGRAVEAGEIRDDITAEDYLKATVALCYIREQENWQETVQRLVDVFIDGLRLRET